MMWFNVGLERSIIINRKLVIGAIESDERGSLPVWHKASGSWASGREGGIKTTAF